MTGLHKFLICLLSVVVAVSLGVTVYYFARSSNEHLSLSETSLGQNIGDTFDITIIQENANKHTTLELKSSNTDIVEFNKKDGLKYTFKAKAAGVAVITLITSNEEFKNTTCSVTVADGVNTPFYIRTAEDLLRINKDDFGLDKKYLQVDNIDMDNKAFTPIGSDDSNKFAGNYNGGNYQISNISLNTTSTYAGLFGITSEDAVISNVIVNDIMIDGTAKYVGGVVAYNNGKVLDCKTTGGLLKTTASDSYAGGVAGINNKEVFTSSFNGGEISSASKLGGVVALNQNGYVQDCYARGSFKPATASEMGGVVAQNIATVAGLRANITNCYSTMKNTDTTNSKVGMVVYRNVNSDNTTDLSNDSSTKNRVYGSYYDTTQGYTGIYGVVDPTNGIFVNALTDKTQAGYATYSKSGSNTTWNFTRVWKIDGTVNNGYPVHQNNAYAYVDSVYIPGVDPDEPPTPTDASIITTKEQLLALDSQNSYGGVDYSWNNSYKLGADINMEGATWASMGKYTATFDGNGHTISNIKINGSFVNELASAATIKNVTFNNVIVENASATLVVSNSGTVYNVNVNNVTVNSIADGVFAGVVRNNSGVIQKVDVNGVNGTFAKAFAGIAYTNNNSARIEEVKVLGGNTITMTSDTAVTFGGIVAHNNGIIKDAKTNVSCNANETANSGSSSYIGGIIAVNSESAIVEKVNFVGNALKLTSANTTTAPYIGGIVAYNKGEIVDAYAKANELTLTSQHASAYAGGIAGVVESTASIKQAKADITTLTSSAYAGGIAGIVNGDKAVITTSGITSDATITAKYVGGLVATFKKGEVNNSYAMATLNGSEQTSGMANELARGAKVQNCYIGTKFANDAKGRKFETQTKIRQGQGGSVSNNVINADAMGGYGKGDSKRQYSNYYIRFNLWVIDYEFNTPDDNLCSDGSCKKISTFTDRGWKTSEWVLRDNAEPVAIAPTVIE